MQSITLHTDKNKLKCVQPREWLLAGPPSPVPAEIILGRYDMIDHEAVPYPDFGPARVYDESQRSGIVLTLGTRRWRVRIDLDWEDRTPAGGYVHLDETTDPETPFHLFDREAPRHKHHPSYHRTNTYFFGQPSFIQSPIYPMYNGKPVGLLCNMDSDWGDAGNENLFLALDEKDTPVGLYHEYSCC